VPSKLTPAQRKELSQAYTWGHLTERAGKIYSRASDEEPVCAKVTVAILVERGWLKPWRSRYEITREGKRAQLELEGRTL
jgi:hypothetical protein